MSVAAEKFCPLCGMRNSRAAGFCAGCGAAFSSRDRPSVAELPLERPPPANPGSTFQEKFDELREQFENLPMAAKYGIGGALVFIVVIGIGVAAFENRKTDTADQIATSPAFPITATPSFDCTKAKTWSARVVCGDRTLAALDVQMAALYAARHAELSTRAARLALRNEQRIWLVEREDCKQASMTIECIKNLYDNRIGELSAPVASTMALPTAYTTPASYCRAVGTDDTPLQSTQYRGPSSTDDMLAALHASRAGFGASRENVVWRCAFGRVVACDAASTTSCIKAPWLTIHRVPANIREICRGSPDYDCAPGTHCIYACRGGSAVLNRNSYPTDARGYYPKEWVAVSTP